MNSCMYDTRGRMQYPEKGGWQSKRFNVVTRQAEIDENYLMDELKKQTKKNLELQDEDSYDEIFKVKPQTTVSFVAAPTYSPSPSASEEIFSMSPHVPKVSVSCRGTDVEEYNPPQSQQVTTPTYSTPWFPRRPRAKSAILPNSGFPAHNTRRMSACMTQELPVIPGWEIEGLEDGNVEGDIWQDNGLLQDCGEDHFDMFTFSNAPYVETRSKILSTPLLKTPSKKRTCRQSEKRTVLPDIEEHAKINHFKKKFSHCSPTFVITVGNWRIPVHLDAIKDACPSLVNKMIEQRDAAEKKLKSARWKPYRNPKTPRKKSKKVSSKSVRRYTPSKKTQRYDVRKRLEELRLERERGKKQSGKKRKPDDVNVYDIEAPARSVIEFLNYVYPQQDVRMGTLQTASEVFGLARLCVKHNMWDEGILGQCVERLRVLLEKEKLKGLLSLLDDNTMKEFEQEVAERLGTMLIQGELSNEDLETISPKVWRLLLTASTWTGGLSKEVNSGRLVAQVLMWVISSMDGVTPDSLAEMLNIVSGFPENSDSCRRFAMAVHNQEKIKGLTKDLRQELQIQFWRKISEYFYAAARTDEMYAQFTVQKTKLGRRI